VVRNGISSWITVLCVASTVRGSAMQYGGAEQSTDFAGFSALAFSGSDLVAAKGRDVLSVAKN